MPELTGNDIIFCDFDGTISRSDVLNKVFTEFGDSKVQKLEEDFRAGKIDDRETLTRKWRRIELDYQEFRNFILKKVKLDPYFARFYGKVKEKGIDFVVLSGGFVNYIELLFVHHNIGQEMPVYGNKLEFRGEQVIPHFLHQIESCHQSFGVCGSCKWQVIQDMEVENKNVIYIGDGLTDRCPAEKADILLVKKGEMLQDYCEEQGIDYFSFEDFSDVEDYLF
ncbi:MAG: MtnX-like HAD-IB family phosphatase [Bacillota bacterium]